MEFDSNMSNMLTDGGDRVDMKLDPKRLMTFHCDQCNAVVGDSLSVCGEFSSMEAIMFLKVTDSVTLSDQTESKIEREMTHCLHRSLECSGCNCVLGSIVESTPQHLEMLRSVFLLHKENINCYILEQCRMVKAWDLVFDPKPIGERMEEAIKQFQALLDRMARVKRRVCKQ